MIKKLKVLCLCFFVLISFGLHSSPANFGQAKKIARRVFSEHRETIYCGCKYDQYNRVDLKSCNMSSSKGKRDRKIEWEHIVAASSLGQHFKCWREKMCTKKNGKKYRGRKCCKKVDQKFRSVEAELYNLWPAVGSVNQYRSNYRFTEFHPDSFSKNNYFNGCPFVRKKVTSKITRVEPRNESKGIVARAYLFMHDRYGLNMSKGQRRLMGSWNKRFPPSAWEIKWANKIAKIEGYSNNYILKREKGGMMIVPRSIVRVNKERPTSFLSVDGYEKCLSKDKSAMLTAWCMPSKKRKRCVTSSWLKLKKIKIHKCKTR